MSSAFSLAKKNWAMALSVEPPPGAPWVTMAGVAGAAPDEFSLGRKGHDLVLALIYCVAFRKSLSFSRPLVKRWARSHPTPMSFSLFLTADELMHDLLGTC